MSLSDEPIIPTDPPPPTPPTREELAAQRARRRRAARRRMIPSDAEGQDALVATLARRAYPSVELFVFSLLCGAVIGLGFLLDSQAVLLLGILLTPLMTPWVGFLLAILTGNIRFLFETVMALLISVVLVFIGGLLAGLGARAFLPITLTNVFIHARLWIPELVVLIVGAILLIASFVRSEDKPFLPSVIIAYTFYLPINAAGFGLGSSVPGIWPQGALVFLVHFALASVFGLLTLLAFRLRPSTSGLVMGGIALLLFVGILLFLMGSGLPAATTAVHTSTPTVTITARSSLTPSPPPTYTSSPQPSHTPTRTITPTNGDTTETVTTTLTLTITSTVTATPSKTLTPTLTLTATQPTATISETPQSTTTLTPIAGKISASEGGGANLRQTPNGKYLMTLDNGTPVEVLLDFKDVNGVTWIHVYVTRNGQQFEGWLLESVVSYATPEPNFGPSSTPVQ